VPLGLRVPAFVMANYEILHQPTVEVAHRPEHRLNAESYAKAADTVTPFVGEWFGTPREKAQVVELFDPGASPFESGAMLLTPLGDTDPKLLQIALVHELAHAAFPSNRPWIYEGLAHFAQAAYRERQGNRQSALDFLGLHRSAVVAAEKVVAERPKDASAQDESLIATSVDEFYRSKAAYVWWMLRDMLGEDTLKKVLASYRLDEDKDPAYVQRLVEAQSKRDLQWFFDDWVCHDRGLPDFRVESAFPRKASQDNYLVTVTVENLGAAGAEVPVTVRFEGGELTQRVEVRAKAKGVVRVATPKPPTEIVVNDGSVPESDMSNNVFKIESWKP
jgi:aminopeptidase N